MKKLLILFCIVISIYISSFVSATDINATELQACWDFDNGALVDSSGNGFNLTDSGLELNAIGVVNAGVQFGEPTDSFSWTDFTTPTTFTVNFWINTTSRESSLVMYTGTDGENTNYIGENVGSFYQIDLDPNTGNGGSDPATPIGTYTMLTMVFNGTYTNMWSDGAIVDNFTYNTGGTFDRFGGGIWTGAFEYQAFIDEVTFWNKSLSNRDIQDLYGGGVTGTPLGCSSLTIPSLQDSPTLSNYNVTSNNTIPIDGTTAWNNSGNFTNITTNLLTVSFETNINSNSSISIDFDGNYSGLIANNPNAKCATTDTTSHSCVLPDNITFGEHCIYISGVNSDGNETATGKSSSGCLNLTLLFPPPKVTAISPPNLSRVIGTNVELRYNVTNLIDINNCSLFINGSFNQTDLTITKNISQLFSVHTELGANNNWLVECYNNETRNNESRNLTYTVNIPPPIVNLSNPTNDSAVGGDTQQLIWTAVTDEDADPLTYSVYFGQTDPPDFNTSTADVNVLIGTSNNGDYFWYVRAYDGFELGNKSETYTFSKIGDPPVLTKVQPSDTSTNNSNVLFNVSIFEDDLNESTVKVNVNGLFYNLVDNFNISTTNYFYRILTQTEGNKSYFFTAQNNDRVLGTSATNNIFVDLSTPTINFTEPTPSDKEIWNTTLNGTNINITVTITEDLIYNIQLNWFTLLNGNVNNTEIIDMPNNVLSSILKNVSNSTEYKYMVCVNDTFARLNCTGNRTIRILESPNPIFSNFNASKGDSPQYEDYFNLSVNIDTSYGVIENVSVEINNSGTSVNFSASNISNFWYVEFNTTTYGITVLNYTWHSNNSLGKTNSSSSMNLSIIKHQTQITFLINNSENNFTMFDDDQNILINGELTCLFCPFNLTLYNESENITIGQRTINETIFIDFTQDVTRQFTINSTGNENYTNGTEIKFVIIEFLGCIITDLEPNELSYPLNYSLINWSIIFTNDTLDTGNYSWNFTEVNITAYNITESVFNITNNCSSSRTVQLKQNQTKDWYEWICFNQTLQFNITDINKDLFNLSVAESKQLNCSLNALNVSQTYVNWRITNDKASHNFIYTMSGRLI